MTSTIAALLVAVLCPIVAQQAPKSGALSSTAQSSTPAGTLAEAETLLQKQQFAEAAEKLQAVVGRDPENPQAWFDLGFAQSRLGKTADAIAAYRKATELSPKWFEANLNLGLALARGGNNADAVTALKKAVTLKPSAGGNQALGKAWSALGELLEQSQPDESLAAYQKAAELDTNDAENFQAIGRLLEARGNTSDAEQQYLKAAKMGSTGAMEQLISMYLKHKRVSDAEIWLRRYLDANPGSAPAQAQLGKVLAAEGRTQDAIAVLQGSAANDSASERELAALYMENKQYEQAAALLQQLLRQRPGDAELHLNLGNALLHQHKYAEAEQELIKSLTQGSCAGPDCHFEALHSKGQLTQAYSDLAFAAAQNKHYELTIRVLDARGKFEPENASTYWLRATSYDNLKEVKPAIENYKLFLQASAGKSPDQEFQARHRLKALQPD